LFCARHAWTVSPETAPALATRRRSGDRNSGHRPPFGGVLIQHSANARWLMVGGKAGRRGRWNARPPLHTYLLDPVFLTRLPAYPLTHLPAYPPLMLRPHQADEHRGEQREHERLKKGDKYLEYHHARRKQRGADPHQVALEQEGQAQ
jgi:hypothetical protein